MNCLYIAEDYIGSRVHHNLCEAIVNEDKNFSISVFSLMREGYGSRDLRFSFGEVSYSAFVVPFEGNSLMYKLLFPYKIEQKFKKIIETISLSDIDFTIAATLFSEGAVAYMLYKEKGIPYNVVVRGSDINFYFQKMPHLRKIGREIIRHAHQVIFITPLSFQKTISSSVMQPVVDLLKEKSLIIPNGINDFWINNRKTIKPNLRPYSVLYVGNFGSNKNVISLIQSCIIARKSCPNLTLHLVGSGGSQEDEVKELVSENSSWITAYGAIDDLDRLLQLYRESSLFVMISHSETFGLVYLEALSQCTPVIYTRDQGFSGLFEEGQVGYPVNPNNEKEVSKMMIKAFNELPNLMNNIGQVDFEQYRWARIAKRWIESIPYSTPN